jgi:hypothetical protein
LAPRKERNVKVKHVIAQLQKLDPEQQLEIINCEGDLEEADIINTDSQVNITSPKTAVAVDPIPEGDVEFPKESGEDVCSETKDGSSPDCDTCPNHSKCME